MVNFLKKFSKTTWEKIFIVTIALVLLLTLALSPDNLNPILFVTNHDPTRMNELITTALDQERRQILHQMQEIRNISTLSEFTQEQDALNLLRLLEELTTKYSFDALQVANKNGTLLASFPNIRVMYTFATTASRI